LTTVDILGSDLVMVDGHGCEYDLGSGLGLGFAIGNSQRATGNFSTTLAYFPKKIHSKS
jgi:hypothetical protein